MYNSRVISLPFQSFINERMHVNGVGSGKEAKGLAYKRESHGTRREFALAFRVPPPINPVAYTYTQKRHYENPNIPYFHYYCTNNEMGKELKARIWLISFFNVPPLYRSFMILFDLKYPIVNWIINMNSSVFLPFSKF